MDYKEELLKLFSDIPPKWDEIRKILDRHKFTSFEIAELAYEIVDDCEYEYQWALNPDDESVTLETMHSPFLIENLKLLLEYGFDPNIPYSSYDDSALFSLIYVDMPNVGAAALRFLLENGANPNYGNDEIKTDTLFIYLTSSITFDKYEYTYKVQCWLVLMAYGACYPDGSIPLEMLNGNKVEIFKDFELFDYSIEHYPDNGCYGNWTMHIFNKKTREEVARYGADDDEL